MKRNRNHFDQVAGQGNVNDKQAGVKRKQHKRTKIEPGASQHKWILSRQVHRTVVQNTEFLKRKNMSEEKFRKVQTQSSLWVNQFSQWKTYLIIKSCVRTFVTNPKHFSSVNFFKKEINKSNSTKEWKPFIKFYHLFVLLKIYVLILNYLLSSTAPTVRTQVSESGSGE